MLYNGPDYNHQTPQMQPIIITPMFRYLLYLIVFLTSTSTFAQVAPEPASGITAKSSVEADSYMAVAANPLAAQVGKDILGKGGSAVDAAIAMQLVLNVVEPQSSGIGGGGFMLYYDARKEKLFSYDGRETAPSGANETMFLSTDGSPLPFLDAVQSGSSVGVPGLLRMFQTAYDKHGTLPWDELFAPAIALAKEGVALSPRLHAVIENTRHLPKNMVFFNAKGQLKPVGSILKYPALAKTLEIIAKQGPDAFYEGKIADAITHTVNTAGGTLNAKDLKNYSAISREPVCGHYHGYKICGMGPPSSGGITVLQILGMVEYFDLATMKPDSSAAAHLILEASRLAYADRNYYIGDSDFVTTPTTELLDPEYLRQRAALINPTTTSGTATPGKLFHRFAAMEEDFERKSTTHISGVDYEGNMVSMTTSIEHAFGSTLTTNGFLLNNQLTDFSFTPEVDGVKVANRVQAGKRPRSSMSPMIIFDKDGKPVMLIGSPGGARIIPYVAQTIIGVLDWKMDIQQAVSQPHYLNMNGQTELEKGQKLEALAEGLKKMGHDIVWRDLNSGLHGIVIDEKKLHGGADPRREGVAVGG